MREHPIDEEVLLLEIDNRDSAVVVTADVNNHPARAFAEIGGNSLFQCREVWPISVAGDLHEPGHWFTGCRVLSDESRQDRFTQRSRRRRD